MEMCPFSCFPCFTLRVGAHWFIYIILMLFMAFTYITVLLCQSDIWCECMVMKVVDIGMILNFTKLPGMQHCVMCKWPEHCNLLLTSLQKVGLIIISETIKLYSAAFLNFLVNVIYCNLYRFLSGRNIYKSRAYSCAVICIEI
jgi:hypothetical protein